MNSQVDLKTLQLAFVRHRASLAFVIIVGLIAYTGWQISRITAVQPDQAYMDTLAAQSKTVSLKTNKTTIEKLKALQPSGDTNIPVTVGKQNPFDLN